MKELNFKQCKGDQDVWMRPSKDKSCYEHVDVNDLPMSIKDPEELSNSQNKSQLQTKR